MPRECFRPKKFSAEHTKIIEQANTIIGEYQGAGFTLTLRQLYYQFVARDIIPNTVQAYNRLGTIISDARLAGEIDWDAIEDRLRKPETVPSWGSPADIVHSAYYSYQEDLWADQDIVPEVWIEKDALAGVIVPVCKRWRMPSLACRGYASQSALYEAGKRFRGMLDEGKTPVVLHMGDHDPSGIDMTRDNADRLAMFAEEGVKVERLALNMNQITQYKPPPNPAKQTDARFAGYITRFGSKSWELDALDPKVIDKLIDDYVSENCVDHGTWEDALAREQKNKDRLRDAARRWDEVAKFLE
jgi:hypothetical protein